MQFWIFLWNLPIFKCRKLIKISMKHYGTKWKQSTLPSKPRSAGWLSWQLLGPSGRRTGLPPGLITDQQPDFGRSLRPTLDLNFFFYRSQRWSERISLVCVSFKMHFLGISGWSFLLTNFHKITKSHRGIPTVATGILLTVLGKGISSSSVTFRTFFSLFPTPCPSALPPYLVFQIIPHALELQLAFIFRIYVVLLHGHEDIL